MADIKLRIAIINPDKCKPKKCRQECAKTCPINKIGKMCIDVKPTSTICFISEHLCIGCGMCIKRCPFQAIKIINLPKGLERQVTHRYGANSFKLHRLPTPRVGQVLGLVGTNGIGKSTALRILSGNMRPNLGNFTEPPEWKEVLKYFRGNELQSFFTRMLEENMKALIKIQYVDSVAKQANVNQAIVGRRLRTLDKKGMFDEAVRILDLQQVLERQVGQLSGGELQRFIIGLTCVQEVDIYMFDEPSSYLDVKQRLNAARMIRSLLNDNKYVIVVEHDLSILDYLSDYICCLYGTPGAYGVVTMPFSVREGINIFLAGYVPTEQMRFRDYELSFRVSSEQDRIENERELTPEEIREKERLKLLNYNYPNCTKTLGSFKVSISEGIFNASEIVVMLGENGTGKTTMINILAGVLKPDDETLAMPPLNISYKPQKIAPKFQGTVQELFHLKLRDTWQSSLFRTEVTIPLAIEDLLDNEVQNLSGGELQRVALVIALAKPCDLYLIDEPSAYLDSEQRILASRVMKRWILNAKRAAFVVEHDFIMATYLADKVIVFSGTPAQEAFASAPEGLIAGMNRFLSMMDITFRRDPYNFRPRINKLNSVKDRLQKQAGSYFLMDEGATRTKKGAADADDDEDEKETKGVFALIEEEESKKASQQANAPLSKKQKKAFKEAEQAAADAERDNPEPEAKPKGKKAKAHAAEEKKVNPTPVAAKPKQNKGQAQTAAAEEEKKAESKGKKGKKAAQAVDDDWVDE